jgi:hypothetical protein
MNGFINNEWDRNNLTFLLSLDDEDAKDFYEQSDEDDRAYAQELLNSYSAELNMESHFLRIEAELFQMNEYKEAQEIIKKVNYV